MATLLGEEALAAASEVRNPASNVQIGGAMQTLQCPGKITTPFNLPRECSFKPHPTLPACVFKDKDTDPVNLNMWLLKVGDVALVQSDSNIMPAVGDKLKQASPLANTLIVSLNFGPMRYVIDDASYVLNTYEATASRAKQGCAEQGFIDARCRCWNSYIDGGFGGGRSSCASLGDGAGGGDFGDNASGRRDQIRLLETLLPDTKILVIIQPRQLQTRSDNDRARPG